MRAFGFEISAFHNNLSSATKLVGSFSLVCDLPHKSSNVTVQSVCLTQSAKYKVFDWQQVALVNSVSSRFQLANLLTLHLFLMLSLIFTIF